MRRWFVIVMAAFGMTLFMLLGLGNQMREEKPDLRRSTISLESGSLAEAAVSRIALRAVVSMDPAAFRALIRATERFQTIRQDIVVTVTNVSADELQRRIRTSTETGDAPDIMLYPTAWVRREAAEGRLLSMDDFVPAERQSHWFETVRGAVRWNGYLWGVPLDWDPYVYVFRTDEAPVLEDDGETPRTTSEWLQLSKDASEAIVESYTYGDSLMLHWSSASFEPNDEDIVADDEEAKAEEGEEGEAEETEQVGEEAEQVGADELTEGSGAVEAVVIASADPQEAEPENERVVIRGTLNEVAAEKAVWAMTTLSEAVKLRMSGTPEALSIAAFVPDQDMRGSLPPFVGDSFVLSPATVHPAEAAEWIRFVTDSETVEEFGLAQGGWPVSRHSFGLQTSFGYETTAALGTIAPAATTLPSLSGLDERGRRNALRPIMRMIDIQRTPYGTPLGDLPLVPFH